MKLPVLMCALTMALYLGACEANTPAAAANDTNPYVGKVISEQGADAGIHSNANMGQGAAGSVGNQ